jgi:hypothetical protein
MTAFFVTSLGGEAGSNYRELRVIAPTIQARLSAASHVKVIDVAVAPNRRSAT